MNTLKTRLEAEQLQIDKILYTKQESTLYLICKSATVLPLSKKRRLEEEIRQSTQAERALIRMQYEGSLEEDGMREAYLDHLYESLDDCSYRSCCERSGICISSFDAEFMQIDVSDELIYRKWKRMELAHHLQMKLAYEWGLSCHVDIRYIPNREAHQEYMKNKRDEVAQLVVAQERSLARSVQAMPKQKKPVASHWKTRGSYADMEITKISELSEFDKKVCVEGDVFFYEKKTSRKNNVYHILYIADSSGAITCRCFLKDLDTKGLKDGYARIIGTVSVDAFTKELCILIEKLILKEKMKKLDFSDEKRVELHMHTNMSAMDGVASAKSIVARAAQYGHRAVAITDHGVVQSFPEAMSAGKDKGVKILYGMEANLVDDMHKLLEQSNERDLNQDFVVFDIETTGLSVQGDAITEIGAVKIRNRQVVDRYSELIDPGRPIPLKIQELTGITNSMVANKRTIREVLPDFMDFCSDSVLVAHNSDFDTGFIRTNCQREGLVYDHIAIDTVTLSRALLPELKRHKLNLVAKHLGIGLENHHRAVDDAEATARIFLRFLEMLEENGVSVLSDINRKVPITDTKKLRAHAAILFAQNEVGLKNLYLLVSDSHIEQFYSVPRVLKSRLNRHREGILVGTPAPRGELSSALELNMDAQKVRNIASYYDYFEITPVAGQEEDIARGAATEEGIQNRNLLICKLGEELDKPVVAASDAYYLDKEDAVYRGILHFSDPKNRKRDKVQPKIYDGSFYRTTDEMLREFAYLGEKKAFEVVVTNTNRIADHMEDILPVPNGTFPPVIEGSDTELREMCYAKAKSIYGDPLPEIVEQRLERELNSIIGNGYAVMYIIAQKLVQKSNERGYIVGSRGSVGSSFAATMSSITEVNPLHPHYVCPKCKHSEFIVDGSYSSGVDLPHKDCPDCDIEMMRDGHTIPFEVFLGFEGDKEPDIDLNFAGEDQSNAHKYTEDLFGSENVYRAGSIGTVAEKTAYGYVKKYTEANQIQADQAIVEFLKRGCSGIKRTSGQHPGGIMVVPDYKDIHDFTPVQYPANDASSGVITTHFDYHSISGRILKLDILGHDTPSIIRMLEDLTGFFAEDVPLDDPDTMSLFQSPNALKCDLSAIGCESGTLAIPEFGTRFVRQMLKDTQPKTFEELIRISGLSHGTDVWLGNAQDLVRNGTATLKETICTRDDIMNYLLLKDLKPKNSFTIMEAVRKGKGVTEEQEADMKAHDVPLWYIDSCKKIKYMFPKAHAAAYVMMSFRIAYYKVNYKEAFYATYFTTKIDDFDTLLILQGPDRILLRLEAYEQQTEKLTAKEKVHQIVLEVAYEMYQRGVGVLPPDLYRSDPKKFRVEEDGKLRPPLIAVSGLGETVAETIAKESKSEFLSIEDLKKRGKVGSAVVESLRELGCLEGMSESNQLSWL